MKNYFLLLICFLGVNAAIFAQEERKTPRFTKINIEKTGCQVYMPAKKIKFDQSTSEDGASIYAGSIIFDGYTYGIVCVKFTEPMPKEGNTELLKAYMEFLKTQFEIVNAIGYGEGHTMETNPDASGVIDYWEDKNGNDFSVKGWIDTEHLAFLYLAGKESYPNSNIVQLFLNGFRFPEKN